MHPSVPAFSSLAYAGSTDPLLFRVELNGLVVGRSYTIQVVMADNRVGAGVGQRTVRIVPFGGMDELSDTDLQPLYSYEGGQQYCVYHLRFIATSTNVLFRPDTYDTTGYIGVHVNAVNILQDVLPSGKVYYISTFGDDNLDGMSRYTPWSSLARVNEETFSPGDRILFQRGGSWSGSLQPKGNGVAGDPIILGAYGDGAHPLITSPGSGAAIALGAYSHWIIDGFEITNYINGQPLGANESYTRGIDVQGDNCEGLVIRNCYVHDVQGLTANRHIGGIQVWGLNRASVLIENNVIENTVGVGIIVRASDIGLGGPDWNVGRLSTDVVIRGNTVRGAGSDSIMVLDSVNPLIEHNHSSYSGLAGKFGQNIAAIWTQYCDGGVQQYNHCHDGKSWLASPGGDNFDGQALGIDYNMKGETVLRYNYVHDNPGGAALNYNNGDYDIIVPEPPSILSHHNIYITTPRVTSGREENHIHDVFTSPDDEFLADWGSANLTMRNSVINFESQRNLGDATTLDDNLWYTLPKIAKDTTGAEGDPLFVSSPGRVLLKDNMVLYPANNTFSVNGDLDWVVQKEPRFFGVHREVPTKYNVLGTPGGFIMGGGETVGEEQWRTMKTAPGAESLLASPINFASGQNTKPVTVRLHVRSVHGTAPDNWLALCIKNSPYITLSPGVWVNHATTDYGLLFRASGLGTQRFTKGTEGGVSRAWADQRGPTYSHVVEAVISGINPETYGFSTNGTRVRVFCDGLLIDDRVITQMSALYLGLNTYVSDWRITSFEVFEGNGEASRYKMYEGLIPSAGSPLINSATPGVAPVGATDFFRGTIDGTPNRGAIEATSLSSYVQTPTRIEIRGRYKISRSASGNRTYNYTATVRDQNSRICDVPVVWSMVPGIPGVSLSDDGRITLTPFGFTLARFVLKATAGDVTQTFPVGLSSVYLP
jgi:hypothetical protein